MNLNLFEPFRLVILVVLDGWGIAPPGPGNAISQAKTPNFDSLWAGNPHGQLQAAGEAVGLPHNEMGNSEVGHLNMGVGFVVYQDVMRINIAIADGSFLKNPTFLEAVSHIKKKKSRLHIIGLLGPSVVHSCVEHLYALLWLSREHNIENVYLHLFTDGRDATPQGSPIYLAELKQKIETIGVGEIATISGRYYGMDRDKRWDRTQKAYQAIVEGIGETAYSAEEAIEKAYDQEITDEFIPPTVILKSSGEPVAMFEPSDAAIFFNFRTDRPRQLTKALCIPNFTDFERKKVVNDLFFVTMTEYEDGLPAQVAFPPRDITMPLARIISERNLRQLHLAETEKYAHVTYFFNGGREGPFPGEDRILVPSPKVVTYDYKPEMSANEITDILIQRVDRKAYHFIIVNYANPDMVSHTGNLSATISAIETVDNCLGKIINPVIGQGGCLLITADHGNAEGLINPQTGEIDTEHSSNPVPFIFVYKGGENREIPMGVLADIAPTVLFLMGIPKPNNMTGKNLLRFIVR